jgi:hypothetical protein
VNSNEQVCHRLVPSENRKIQRCRTVVVLEIDVTAPVNETFADSTVPPTDNDVQWGSGRQTDGVVKTEVVVEHFPTRYDTISL